MPGLLAIVGREIDFSRLALKHEAMGPLVSDSQTFPGACLSRFTNPKFLKDKVFQGDDEVAVALEGVVYNFAQLQQQYGCEDYFQTVKMMYRKKGDTFFKEFNGDFSGMLYDKAAQRWVMFTNHTGSKPLYFYHADGLFVCSSQFDVVSRVLRSVGRRFSLDVFGAYCLLSFAFMLEDHTLISEVKRLKPGHYLTLDQGRVSVSPYLRFHNTPEVRESKDDIIEHLDMLFRTAVARQYDKDREYGYEHLSTLSGGMDSRTNLWIAYEMGYRPLIALTFAQNNYLDERIAKRIAADMKIEFLFYSLNHGHYLKPIFRDAVRANGGLVLFSGAAHLLSALRRVSMRDVGSLHMGQVGDAVLGSFLQSPRPCKASFASGAYSPHLLDRIGSEVRSLIEAYESEDTYLMYSRGFNGALNGNWTAYQYTEVASPFMDPEVLDYAMRIPRPLRYQRRIYLDWLLKKYPGSTRYTWEHAKARPCDPLWWQKVSHLMWQARIVLTRNWDQMSMNPFYHWYKSNEELRNWIDGYWTENHHVLDPYPELKKDCDDLYHQSGRLFCGPLAAKTQIMTLLEAIKLHWE